MGIFDFLKRKRKSPPADSGPSPEYVFAHYALRQIALSDPLQFLALLASSDAEEFIDAVLKDVAEQCGLKTSFDASSVKIHKVRLNAFPCVVISLPEPKEMAEAFMVALVVLIDTSSERTRQQDKPEARYFTLEKGFSLSNEPRTVMAEWDSEAHSNYGDGPAPTVQAFTTAIEGLLR